MIKLFRNIRKVQLSNRALNTYLFYALGEIALVVAGILIALSIDNWNDKKIQRKIELQIYKNIQSKVNDDKKVVQGVIDYNNYYTGRYQLANRILSERDKSRADSLIQIIPELFRYSDFNGSDNIYQILVNSGELKLLQNEAIIAGIQNLEESYIYMNRLEENHFQAIVSFINPEILDNINFSNSQTKNLDLVYSFSMQNAFIMFMELMAEKNMVYVQAIEEIDTISELIHKELNQ